MKFFALMYQGVPDYFEKRTPLREGHLARAREAQSRGELLMAGALENPPGSLFIFRCEDDGPVRAFAAADPYVTGNIVLKWSVQPWLVSIGGD